MLLEIGVADSYACAFEYARPYGHRVNNLLTYYSHPKWKNRPGQYTDDTEMSICLAELLIEKADWTPLTIANKFVDVFKRNGQITGYSMKFHELLCSVTTGQELLDRIKPDSGKSGAAMRSGPLGFLPTIEQVMQYAEIQAKITHNTEMGIAASQAIALMAHYFIYNLGKKADLPAFLEEKIRGADFEHDLRTPWAGKVGELGMESAHAAVQMVTTLDSLSEIIIQAVEFGGDCDTSAAMSMAGASVCSEIKQDIPENLVALLDNGPYGRDFLIELDGKLAKLKS